MDNTRPHHPNEWHASPALLERYAMANLDVAHSASVEHHLLACANCRRSFADLTQSERAKATELDDLWLDVVDAVDQPHYGRVRALLFRLGLSDRTLRLVATTPAVRWSWCASILVTVTFAAWHAAFSEGADALLLVVAPLIPLVGIGAAYGAGADPLHELVRSAPTPGSRIFLLRSMAVLVTAIPLTVVASLLLRFDGFAAVGWLLPALGLAAVTMALSTWAAPWIAATIASGGWLTVLFVSWLRVYGVDDSVLQSTFVFRPVGQSVSVLLALVGAAIFAARSSQFDQPINKAVKA